MPAERRRRRLSVRVRVTVLATIAVAGVLVLASVLLVTLQLASAHAHLDETLSDEAEAIGVAIERGEPIPRLADDDRVVVVFDADGAVVQSLGIWADVTPDTVVTPDDKGTTITIGGQSHRVVSEPYQTPDGRSAPVIVAEPRDELDDSVRSLLFSLAWIVPVAVLLLFGVVWFAVGRALRPVEQIRTEVAEIGIARLGDRVHVPESGDEIARLATTMNEMLARLERSLRRQQQFVADASHELRTPLTRMRSELEADERYPDRADPAATRRSQLEEIGALQELIDDMLVLARSDAGVIGTVHETLDLDDIVREEAAALASGITIDASRLSGAQVSGDAGELRRAVRNLFDNARRHARSEIAVGLAEGGGTVTLTIDDDGPGIPPQRRSEVFERFSKLDASRHGTGGRAGLGLAIVAEIVTSHGGTVSITDSPLGGARLTVTLPSWDHDADEGPTRVTSRSGDGG